MTKINKRANKSDKTYERDCKDCIEILEEKATVTAIRMAVNEDLRGIIKEELQTHSSLAADVTLLNSWNLKIPKTKILIVPLFVIIVMIGLIVYAIGLLTQWWILK